MYLLSNNMHDRRLRRTATILSELVHPIAYNFIGFKIGANNAVGGFHTEFVCRWLIIHCITIHCITSRRAGKLLDANATARIPTRIAAATRAAMAAPVVPKQSERLPQLSANAGREVLSVKSTKSAAPTTSRSRYLLRILYPPYRCLPGTEEAGGTWGTRIIKTSRERQMPTSNQRNVPLFVLDSVGKSGI